MKAIYYLFGILLGLIILIFIEGMMTLGSCFSFEYYSTFVWIIQGILILFTISGSIIATHEQIK